MHILNTLAPVFLIIALGAVLTRTGRISADFEKGLNWLTFWIALPALLFYKTAASPLNYTVVGKTLATVLAGMVITIAIGYLLAFFMKMPRGQTASFVQGGYRSNLAYIGLPVIIYSFSKINGGEVSPATEATAVMVVAAATAVYNIAAVLILYDDRAVPAHRKVPLPLKLTKVMLQNPLFLSCVLGLAFSELNLGIHPAVRRTLAAVGQMALPMALLAIGAGISKTLRPSHIAPALVSSLIKVAAAPLVGYYIALWIGLGSENMRIAMILLACPTAVASYVMAQQLGADEKLAGLIIVISTVLSVFSLGAVVAMF